MGMGGHTWHIGWLGVAFVCLLPFLVLLPMVFLKKRRLLYFSSLLTMCTLATAILWVRNNRMKEEWDIRTVRNRETDRDLDSLWVESGAGGISIAFRHIYENGKAREDLGDERPALS